MWPCSYINISIATHMDSISWRYILFFIHYDEVIPLRNRAFKKPNQTKPKQCTTHPKLFSVLSFNKIMKKSLETFGKYKWCQCRLWTLEGGRIQVIFTNNCTHILSDGGEFDKNINVPPKCSINLRILVSWDKQLTECQLVTWQLLAGRK